MSRISITKDGAQVLSALVDKYESSGHPCFKLNHEEECQGDPKICSDCKHAKSLQRLVAALYKAGATP